jgi:hypothetical protein
VNEHDFQISKGSNIKNTKLVSVLTRQLYKTIPDHGEEKNLVMPIKSPL